MERVRKRGEGVKQEIVICDCCGRQIPSLTYYLAIPKFLSSRGVEHQEPVTWLVCNDCIREIGRRVREQTEPIDFEVEVNK